MKNISVIELCINDEKDLYNKFTVSANNTSNKKINDKIIDYLMAETENTPIHDPLVISVKLFNKTDIEISRIEKMIKENITEKINSINKTLRRLRIYAIICTLIGMFLIGTIQFMHAVESRYPLNEFIIVMSWVFMWKAVEFMFFDKIKLRRDKRFFLKIYNAEIERNQDFQK